MEDGRMFAGLDCEFLERIFLQTSWEGGPYTGLSNIYGMESWPHAWGDDVVRCRVQYSTEMDVLWPLRSIKCEAISQSPSCKQMGSINYADQHQGVLDCPDYHDRGCFVIHAPITREY